MKIAQAVTTVDHCVVRSKIFDLPVKAGTVILVIVIACRRKDERHLRVVCVTHAAMQLQQRERPALRIELCGNLGDGMI
jgi:hypothetical protein